MSQKVKKKKNGGKGLLVLSLMAVVCAAAVIVVVFLPDLASKDPAKDSSGDQSIHVDLENQKPINLGYGLEIVDAGRYTGLYMEDGSNEILSDMMMVVVRNSGESDFQLAEITANCGAEEYHFTLTNLAVGGQAVLLDQNRKPAVDEPVTSAIMDTPVLFQEPMSLQEDVIQVSGLKGMLNVKNISASDIANDIYVYYKYAGQDIFYGGITFRVCVEGGLKSGEIRQIPAGHYSPDGCAIVQVTTHG